MPARDDLFKGLVLNELKKREGWLLSFRPSFGGAIWPEGLFQIRISEDGKGHLTSAEVSGAVPFETGVAGSLAPFILGNRLIFTNGWCMNSFQKSAVAGWMLVLLSAGLNLRGGQSVLVISNATLIDATGAPAKPHITVVIDGGRITEIGDAARI